MKGKEERQRKRSAWRKHEGARGREFEGRRGYWLREREGRKKGFEEIEGSRS